MKSSKEGLSPGIQSILNEYLTQDQVEARWCYPFGEQLEQEIPNIHELRILRMGPFTILEKVLS